MPSANDPRALTGWDEQDAHFQTVASLDGTITVPSFTTSGLTNSPSPQVGLAVTNVATGTAAPQLGLGAAGGRLFGKVKAVEPDGTATIQDRGYMTLPYVTGGSVPVIGSAVDVDGTGKVQTSATFRGAVCEGFVYDANTGVTACLVRRF